MRSESVDALFVFRRSASTKDNDERASEKGIANESGAECRREKVLQDIQGPIA